MLGFNKISESVTNKDIEISYKPSESLRANRKYQSITHKSHKHPKEKLYLNKSLNKDLSVRELFLH